MTDESPAVRPCVVCGRPRLPAYHPFCSRRCADLDLQRWLTGGYVIPGDEDDEGAAPLLKNHDEG